MAVSFVVLAAVFWLPHSSVGTETVVNTPAQNTASLVAVAGQSLFEDRDNDQLPDWEETLRKTDPKNPDSDGDGIIDGEEEYDRRTSLEKIDDRVLAIPAEGLSQTEKFGRELLAEYMERKMQGRTFDERATADITEKFVGDIAQDTPFVLYNKESIQTIGDSSHEAFTEYGNRMGRIFIRNTPDNLESATTVVTRALEKEDKTALEGLAPLTKSFETSLSETLTVPVPKDIANLHVSLLNALSINIAALKGLRNIFEDPLVAMIRVGQYEQSTQAIQIVLREFATFYQERGISFGSNDEGGAFIGTL